MCLQTCLHTFMERHNDTGHSYIGHHGTERFERVRELYIVMVYVVMALYSYGTAGGIRKGPRDSYGPI